MCQCITNAKYGYYQPIPLQIYNIFFLQNNKIELMKNSFKKIVKWILHKKKFDLHNVKRQKCTDSNVMILYVIQLASIKGGTYIFFFFWTTDKKEKQFSSRFICENPNWKMNLYHDESTNRRFFLPSFFWNNFD